MYLGWMGTGLEGQDFSAPWEAALCPGSPGCWISQQGCSPCPHPSVVGKAWFPKRREQSIISPERKGEGWVMVNSQRQASRGRGLAVTPFVSWFSISTEPGRDWPPSPQIFASYPKRPFWKLPCWEGIWSADPLSGTTPSGTRAETKIPREWVIHMLFLLTSSFCAKKATSW